jgi:hypothetical protein
MSGNPVMAEDYLPIVHLVFGNLKSWLRGCHHGVSPQHLQAYLNEFAFRFDRRFYPFNSVPPRHRPIRLFPVSLASPYGRFDQLHRSAA